MSEAIKSLETVEEVKETLLRADFSHVSYRRWCGVDILYFYKRDADSPTQVFLVASCRETPEIVEVIRQNNRSLVAGGQMGRGAR